EDVRRLLEGHGYAPRFVEGDDPAEMHEVFATALDETLETIAGITATARSAGVKDRPRWPVIVLRTPKGWTGPRIVDGKRVEGTFRAHQVPIAEVRTNPAHLKMLEAWMKSYRPEELFDANGAFDAKLAALSPRGELRMSASPHANGGLLSRPLAIPSIDDY